MTTLSFRVIVIGETAVVGIPGEAFVEIGLEIKRRTATAPGARQGSRGTRGRRSEHRWKARIPRGASLHPATSASIPRAAVGQR
jgi:hypothetical protein